MSAVLMVAMAVVTAVGAVGLYRLSAWLERWDYQRHFYD